MPNIIKLLRVEKGMTQEELGEYLGVKKSAIQKYESGAITNLKIDTIKKLCDLFEVAPANFIYNSDVQFKDITPDFYHKINQKALKSKEFAMIMVNAIPLNDNALHKINDYINDLSKINEYKESDK